MKKILLFALILLSISIQNFAQQTFYDVSAGFGYGIRFWSSDNYKIHMGSSSEYTYGPVTHYSIKMNMNDRTDRGWTWGVVEQNPIAALNTEGTMQLAKDLRVMGRLGIGTDNPQKVLHSVGNFNMVQLRLERTGSNVGVCDLGGSNGDFRVWSGGYDLQHRFVIKGANGNVGIGTTNPITKLQIEGNGGIPAADYTTLSEKSSFILSSTSSASNGGIGTNTKLYAGIGSSQFVWLQAYNNHNSGSAQDIALNPSGGNVGIGTTTPGNYRLAVEGKIGAREIVVTETSWADFVFEPTYKLKTLEEVESFIKVNKHLPDVPSEKEVIENGLSLGQSDAVLLQKIEELTLYLIEQNKEVKKLKVESKKVKALEKENEILKSAISDLINRIEKLESTK